MRIVAGEAACRLRRSLAQRLSWRRSPPAELQPLGGRHEQHRGADRADEAEEVQLPDAAGAEPRRDQPAGDRAEQAREDRHRDADPLAAGKDESGR